jgi:hypothetical protein
MTAPRYVLRTIADVLLIPADRREVFWREYTLALGTLELMAGEHAHAGLTLPFVWTDDGDESVSLDMIGERFTVEITKDAA